MKYGLLLVLSLLMLSAPRCLAGDVTTGKDLPFTIHPFGIGMSTPTEDIVATIRHINKTSGVTYFALHAPGHSVRISGYFDEAGYRNVGRRVKAVQDIVSKEGIHVGYIMGPTLNVGINHPWTLYMRPDGTQRLFTACPGDVDFQRVFARHCAAVAQECKPYLYMMEDDFRYWDACYCTNHLARFSKLHGCSWTRETLRAEFARQPKLHEEYRQFCLKDLLHLAREAAKAIHAVSPDTRVGLSAPGGYREESMRMAHALADGKRPFIRWYGSDYGFDIPMNFPEFLWIPLWSKQNLSEGMECVYEADACPNTPFYGSGTRVVAAASTLLANGFDGLWFWLGGVTAVKAGDPLPNLHAYAKKRYDLAAVAKCGREGSPVGLSARTATAGRLMARYGFPYKTTAGGVEMYAGARAFDALTDDEIRTVLAGRVFLDGDAAYALNARGFVREIGARASKRKGLFDFNAERVVATDQKINSSYHANYGMDCSAVFRLEPQGGEEVSCYVGGTDGRRVQSSVLRHVNDLGGRVVVMAASLTDCKANNILNYRKRNLLLEMFTWLGGDGVIPVRTDQEVNVMLFANEDARKTRLFVHMTQLSCDPLDAMSLVVTPPYRGGRVEVLEDGVWKPVDATWQDGRVTVPCKLHIFDTLAVRITRR